MRYLRYFWQFNITRIGKWSSLRKLIPKYRLMSTHIGKEGYSDENEVGWVVLAENLRMLKEPITANSSIGKKLLVYDSDGKEMRFYDGEGYLSLPRRN